MMSNISVNITSNVKIMDGETGELLVNKKNAVHPQNMARIIARALAGEENGYIYRIAFGNGGTVTDPTGNIIFNPTNDGRNGSWESRLYNETYSEIIDERDVNFGSDPGSAEPGNIRTGGGATPEDDPEGGGVTSVEVGTKSNVIISMFINKNEPTGQFKTINDFGVEIDATEKEFVFDELGLYSSGKQAAATSGYSSVNVGNKNSDGICLLTASTAYVLHITVNGTSHNIFFTTPAAGSGPAGALTFGDICEGLNTSSWLNVGSALLSDYAFVYITDHSGGAYPSILNRESYGLLTFQSLTSGVSSSVFLTCANESSPANSLYVLTNSICDNVNVNTVNGGEAGVLNDIIDPTNERERLLTHMVFPPIIKTADKALNIVYTLTISIARTTDSRVIQTQS